MIPIAVPAGTTGDDTGRFARWRPAAPAMASAAMPPVRWVRIDPNLRGRVSPSALARLRAGGLCVHRIGAAAYVHDAERVHRWILAVIDADAPAPAFLPRLDAHHRWLRRRGGEPLPREQARLDAFHAAFAAAPSWMPWWKRGLDS